MHSLTLPIYYQPTYLPTTTLEENILKDTEIFFFCEMNSKFSLPLVISYFNGRLKL